MSGLSCSELMAVSSTLSKAGSEQTDLEGEREAWTVVMRETSRCGLTGDGWDGDEPDRPGFLVGKAMGKQVG